MITIIGIILGLICVSVFIMWVMAMIDVHEDKERKKLLSKQSSSSFADKGSDWLDSR